MRHCPSRDCPEPWERADGYIPRCLVCGSEGQIVGNRIDPQDPELWECTECDDGGEPEAYPGQGDDNEAYHGEPRAPRGP